MGAPAAGHALPARRVSAAVAPRVVAAVYAHAPFCARRCTYCDFAVTVRRRGDAAAWAAALRAELDLVEREGIFALAPTLESLYVGGGTPSLLGPDAMRLLAEVVGRDRLRGGDLEWTAEANPESLTPEVATAWRDAGVGRLSIGVQTFHAEALRWMGRLHGPDGAERAVRVARDAGLGEISVDLMFGLPESVGRSWRRDLERALALAPPHVSLYGLSVEPATPLGRAVAEGRVPAVDEERYRAEYLFAADFLRAEGYEHYEVSNFARPGHASRHNAVYWDGRPYLGIGNGAHSYAHPLRRWNVRDWAAYQERVVAGRSPEEARERVDDDAHRMERIWLGLRTRQGVPAPAAGSPGEALMRRWRREGWATLEEERVRLTPQGWMILDELSVQLDAVQAG